MAAAPRGSVYGDPIVDDTHAENDTPLAARISSQGHAGLGRSRRGLHGVKAPSDGSLQTLAEPLEGIVDALELHANRAGEQGRVVLEEAAKSWTAIARDTLAGKLTLQQGIDFTRKAELAVESRLATIARQTTRSYVKSVISLFVGGASKLASSFNWPIP